MLALFNRLSPHLHLAEHNKDLIAHIHKEISLFVGEGPSPNFFFLNSNKCMLLWNGPSCRWFQVGCRKALFSKPNCDCATAEMQMSYRKHLSG